MVGTPANIAAYTAASDPANFHPRLPRYGRLTHDQDRVGLTGSFQFRPQSGTLFTFDMLYSKLKATRQEDFLEAISFSRTLTQGGKPQTSVVDTAYGTNGALLPLLPAALSNEVRYPVVLATYAEVIEKAAGPKRQVRVSRSI